MEDFPSPLRSDVSVAGFETRIELRPLADGTTLLSTLSGRQFKLYAPPKEIWEQIWAYAQGEEVPAGFENVTALLMQTGVFAPAPDVQKTPLLIGLYGDQALCASLLCSFSAAWEKTFTFALMENAGDDLRKESVNSYSLNIGLFERFDWQRMQQLEHHFQRVGLPYIFFHLERDHAFFGPYLLGGDTLTYQDIYERRLCAASDLTNLRLLMTSPDYGKFAPDQKVLHWSLSTLLLQIQQWLQGDQSIHPWTEVELEPRHITTTLHPVQPMPHRIPHTAQLPPRQPQDLVDARTGIVTKVERIRFSTPAATGLQTAQTWVADLRRVYDRDASAVNSGCSYTSYDEASAIAVGEALERYCGCIIRRDRLILGSYDDLTRHGYHCIEPEQFVLFSDRQYAQPDFPFIRFTRDLPMYWIKGVNLTAGLETLLPACLVYIHWYTGEFANDNAICPINFAGVSAGPSIDQALANALEEVVERDSMMVWWLNAARLRQVAPPPQLITIFHTAQEQGYRPWLLHIPNEFGMPTVAAVVENVHDPIATVGFACRNSLATAAIKAWTEAVGLQETILDMQQPEGILWKQGKKRIGTLNGLHPFREDRSYADVYRKDFSDVTGLFAQLQAHLDPRIGGQTRSILMPSEQPPIIGDGLKAISRDAQTYRRRIEKAGFSVYMCELTTPDVAATGLHVVRVLVPGLVPNFPTAYRPLGRDRVRLSAVQLGWRAQPLEEEQMNILPLPYA